MDLELNNGRPSGFCYSSADIRASARVGVSGSERG